MLLSKPSVSKHRLLEGGPEKRAGRAREAGCSPLDSRQETQHQPAGSRRGWGHGQGWAMWAERGKQKAAQQKAGQGREAAQCERRCQAGVGGGAGESLEKGF